MYTFCMINKGKKTTCVIVFKLFYITSSTTFCTSVHLPLSLSLPFQFPTSLSCLSLSPVLQEQTENGGVSKHSSHEQLQHRFCRLVDEWTDLGLKGTLCMDWPGLAWLRKWMSIWISL